MANEKPESVLDICQKIRDAGIPGLADHLEAAWKREREEIVDAVSVLRDGMCPHCDMQQQCAEGED